MKRFMILVCGLLLSGCAGVSMHKVVYDEKGAMKEDCSATYNTMFKGVERINMNACGGKGEAEGAKVDTEALKGALDTIMQAVVIK